MAEDRAKVFETDNRYYEAMQVTPCIAERDPLEILIELEDEALVYLVIRDGLMPTHDQIASQLRVWLAA